MTAIRLGCFFTEKNYIEISSAFFYSRFWIILLPEWLAGNIAFDRIIGDDVTFQCLRACLHFWSYRKKIVEKIKKIWN